MSVDNAILLTFIVLFSLNIGNTFAECVSKSPCTCVMPNGESYDLSKITGPNDEFIQSTTLFNRTFYFHPCNNKVFSIDNTKINTTGCASTSGISLCMYNATNDQSITLGVVKESRLTSKFINLPQIIISHESSPAKTIVVTIDLFCNPRADFPTALSEYNFGPNATNYNLHLVSPQACRIHVEGLSTGSVLVIILFVFSGIYFAGGALALKLLRGATGWEMLPNHKFWFDLPALVRDGIAFTFNGCKVVSYDQI